MEVKYFDSSVNFTIPAPTDCSGGEASTSLNLIAQGDDPIDRNGRAAHVLSCHVKGVVEVPTQTDQTASDQAPQVFIALVLDTQANGAALNSEDVFVNKLGAYNTAAGPMLNLQFRRRFKVLRTVNVTCAQPDLTWDGTNMEQAGQTYPFNMYKKWKKPKEFLFSGTSGAIGNVVSNNLALISFCSNSNAGAKIYANSRIRFTG